MIDIVGLVASLRATGGDSTAIEVKSAKSGILSSLNVSMCALANLPGGGRLVLGLDEATGFTAVGLTGTQTLKQALGQIARSLTPPAVLSIHDVSVDGHPVIVADVAECPPAQKPCVVRSSGKAYGRSYDGDYELSELERQAFLVGRSHPATDHDPVPGTNRTDLDRELLRDWLATVRERAPTGLGRFKDDGELLFRGGVIAATGELTLAGLLALGVHPQQYVPRYVIQLAASTEPGAPVRATGMASLDGPIPTMLEAAMAWARTHMRVKLASRDGVVRDEYEYPLDAFRELISNALVHRDLAAWSRGLAIEVRHLPDRLVVVNPGGLFGISVDRLGASGVTSARNARLLSICQYVRTRDEGARVVEALATGIPTVTASLANARLPPARFIDTAIRFTVILSADSVPRARTSIRGRTARSVWDAMDRELTAAEIVTATGLSLANVRRVLRDFRSGGLIVVAGGQGRRTTYRRIHD